MPRNRSGKGYPQSRLTLLPIRSETTSEFHCNHSRKRIPDPMLRAHDNTTWKECCTVLWNFITTPVNRMVEPNEILYTWNENVPICRDFPAPEM